jgi:hypothetical protein
MLENTKRDKRLTKPRNSGMELLERGQVKRSGTDIPGN